LHCIASCWMASSLHILDPGVYAAAHTRAVWQM